MLSTLCLPWFLQNSECLLANSMMIIKRMGKDKASYTYSLLFLCLTYLHQTQSKHTEGWDKVLNPGEQIHVWKPVFCLRL